jgi:hypothetical protein
LRSSAAVIPAFSQVRSFATDARYRVRSTTRAMRTRADWTSEAEPSINSAGVIIAAMVDTATDDGIEVPTFWPRSFLTVSEFEDSGP